MVEIDNVMDHQRPTSKHTLEHAIRGFEKVAICPGLWVKGVLEDIAEYADECRHGVEYYAPTLY